jgi:LemA protein
MTVGCAAMLLRAHNLIAVRAERVEAARAQVETQLQRRADLVPALVRVTKRHGELEAVLRAPPTPSTGEIRLQSRETPAPSTSETYRALEAQLAGAENRLAIARWRYAEAVRLYNASLQTLPGRIVAIAMKLQPRQYQ